MSSCSTFDQQISTWSSNIVTPRGRSRRHDGRDLPELGARNVVTRGFG
jgi:hypothetical protein